YDGLAGVWYATEPGGQSGPVYAEARGSIYYPDSVGMREGAIGVFRLQSITGGLRVIFEDGLFGDDSGDLERSRPQVFLTAENTPYENGEDPLPLFTLRT